MNFNPLHRAPAFIGTQPPKLTPIPLVRNSHEYSFCDPD